MTRSVDPWSRKALLHGLAVILASVIAAPWANCYMSCYYMSLVPVDPLLPAARVGYPYEQYVCLRGYNVQMWDWTVGALPPGLSWEETYSVPSSYGCNQLPGVRIYGVPTTEGTSYVPVSCITINCGTWSETYTLNVGSNCGIQVSGSPPGGKVGDAYAANLTASNGTPPYTFALQAGSLPPGLVLASWGAIFGTPSTPGTYCFDVVVTDGTGCTAMRNVCIDIACAQLAVSPPVLPEATVGGPYDLLLTVSGGAPPLDFSIVAGSLPAGISLSSSGRISGVAAARGPASFTLLVWDANGCTATAGRDLAVLGRLDSVAALGSGPGNENRVRVVADPGVVPVDLIAYGAGSFGAEAAAGDLDADLRDDLVTGPGPGPTLGPHVRGFDASGGPVAGLSFYAYGTLRYGVHPAAPDLDGDRRLEIVTGAGSGAVFGPHVRGFLVPTAPMPDVNYFAYGTLKYGVHVAAGDLDADGLAELLTGPGPGPAFGPTVRGWSYGGLPVRPLAGVAFDAFPAGRHGVRVGSGDLELDDDDDLIAGRGAGPGETTQVRGFSYGGASVLWLPGCDATFSGARYGATVGGGDATRDGRGDVVAGAGPDPAVAADIWHLVYDGTALVPARSLDAFPGRAYGVNAAAGHLDH